MSDQDEMDLEILRQRLQREKARNEQLVKDIAATVEDLRERLEREKGPSLLLYPGTYVAGDLRSWESAHSPDHRDIGTMARAEKAEAERDALAAQLKQEPYSTAQAYRCSMQVEEARKHAKIYNESAASWKAQFETVTAERDAWKDKYETCISHELEQAKEPQEFQGYTAKDWAFKYDVSVSRYDALVQECDSWKTRYEICINHELDSVSERNKMQRDNDGLAAQLKACQEANYQLELSKGRHDYEGRSAKKWAQAYGELEKSYDTLEARLEASEAEKTPLIVAADGTRYPARTLADEQNERLRAALEKAEEEARALPLGCVDQRLGDSVYNHAIHWLRLLRVAIDGK